MCKDDLIFAVLLLFVILDCANFIIQMLVIVSTINTKPVIYIRLLWHCEGFLLEPA